MSEYKLSDPPDFARAERAANELVKKLGYFDPPVDARRIARDLGLDVKFATFEGANSDIAGFIDLENHAIFVNRDESPERQNFTIAHEMGHKVLHEEYARSENYTVLLRSQFGESKDRCEREADSFAANLLVPRFMLNRYRKFASKEELADLFLVSQQVIATRLTYYRDFA